MTGYKKIPKRVHEAISGLDADTFYIAAKRTYDASSFPVDRWTALGVSFSDGVINHPESLVPPPVARWAKWNASGREIVLRDQPKIPKAIGGWEVPIYGDWKKGSFFVSQERMVYRRTTIHGKNLALEITSDSSESGELTLSFRVDRLFDTKAIDEVDLLMACSLLRECTGLEANVMAGSISMKDWLQTQWVEWEFLPPGTSDESLVKLISKHFNPNTPQTRIDTVNERMREISALGHRDVVIGKGHFARYVAYRYRDDLVALEALDYGNALYLMFDDWEDLSKRSRLSLLADPEARYVRIVHSAGWQKRFREQLALRGHAPETGA